MSVNPPNFRPGRKKGVSPRAKIAFSIGANSFFELFLARDMKYSVKKYFYIAFEFYRFTKTHALMYDIISVTKEFRK